MKTLTTAFLACLVVCSAQAQGTILFCNAGPGLNAPVFRLDGVTKLTGPTYRARLLAGLTPSILQVLAQTPFLTGAGAGYFNGGVVSFPDVAPGTTVWVRIQAWDTTLGGTTAGATFEQAQQCWYLGGYPDTWGQSCGVFPVVLGGTCCPPAPPQVLTGLHSFSLFSNAGLGRFCGFTLQPQSQTVAVGARVSFSVAVDAFPQPWSYQWYFNGSAISGANSSVYTIPDAQLTDAGSYSATTSGLWGGYQHDPLSDAAILTVLSPVAITAQPLSRTAESGSTPSFLVMFTASPPTRCQWYLGRQPIAGATNPVLTLGRVQSAQAGLYSVLISNAIGSVTSAPAALSVIPPVPRRPIPTLELGGEAGTQVNVDYADTLGPLPLNWQLLSTIALTNPPQFQFDLLSPNPPKRYYRAWQSGAPIVRPALGLHMVSGIVLTGPIGTSVRLEAINMIGPTDAWFPVATIVLTNTYELYPDVSSIGQPPRLWRVIAGP